jgi:hypothetical protein
MEESKTSIVDSLDEEFSITNIKKTKEYNVIFPKSKCSLYGIPILYIPCRRLNDNNFAQHYFNCRNCMKCNHNYTDMEKSIMDTLVIKVIIDNEYYKRVKSGYLHLSDLGIRKNKIYYVDDKDDDYSGCYFVIFK